MFSDKNIFLSVSDCVTPSSITRMVAGMLFAVFESFRSVSPMGCQITNLENEKSVT
jgi:hypothetical protein